MITKNREDSICLFRLIQYKKNRLRSSDKILSQNVIKFYFNKFIRTDWFLPYGYLDSARGQGIVHLMTGK